MRIALVLSFLAIITGCSVDRKTAPETTDDFATGALVVDWTVSGAAQADTCAAADASVIDLTIIDSTDQRVARSQQSCDAFATTVDLDAGTYSGEAQLIGAGGVPRTRVVPIDFFTINDRSQLSLAVDFPRSAFLVVPE